MGWTVYYEGHTDDPISDGERATLAAHTAEWTARLHDGCESYAWREEQSGRVIRGMTKVQGSSDDQADFATIVRATQELETLLDRFEFTISDDYVVTEKTKPSDVAPE